LQYIHIFNILLGTTDPLDRDITIHQVILILKYYLYKLTCVGDKPSIKYLKYYIIVLK